MLCDDDDDDDGGGGGQGSQVGHKGDGHSDMKGSMSPERA